MPTRHILVIFIATVISMFCYQRASRNRYATTLADAMGIIEENYVESIDSRELFEGAMRGMTAELDDYSQYVDSEMFEELHETIDQQFGGVGMVVDSGNDLEWPLVIRVQRGGPAEAAGVRAYDSIIKIDGKATSELPPGGAVELIRGAPGTTVDVEMRSLDDELRTLTLTRDIIPVETVRGYRLDEAGNWEFFFPERPEVGYFWIEAFGENTARELRDAIESSSVPWEAIVIDLRGNGGGLLETAIAMCDLFIDRGDIVAVKGRDERTVRRFTASAAQLLPSDIPVFILVDGFSASASEIFAACLQDHDRGVVVGQRSYGKGTVQHVIELEPQRSALRLTTATYWRPSGENIHRLGDATEEDRWGVSPNVGYEIELTSEQQVEAARARMQRFRAVHPDVEREDIYLDPQLERALEAVDASLTPVPAS
ncbi:MAG: S41 family peptidase [Planctomycetota bacterium]